MGAATFNVFPGRRESLRGTIALSIVFHASLFAVAAGYTALGFRRGPGWGNSWSAGRSVQMNAVASLPGVPLPAPMLATPNTLANENPGLYQNELQALPTERAEEILKFQQAIKPEKVLRINKRIQKRPLETPDNAIPYGLGGKPSMTSSQFTNSAGEGALSVVEGNFGDRYGWYVAAVRNRISTNWLLSLVSPNIVAAPRVYLTFDILRDGGITNVEITQSSGIAEVDRSALRAVLASNPLGPLPSDYSGSRVHVEFYFDFHRR